MPGKNDIVAGIRLEGEQEFKTGITSINKTLSANKSELSKVSAEYDGQANTVQALTKKQEVLNRILDEQKRKVEATKTALNNAQTNYEKVGKGLQGLRTELERANTKRKELENTYGSSSDEAKAQQKEIDRLSAAIGEGENNYKKAADRIIFP